METSTSPPSSLTDAIDIVPAGAWAVGVSGGADSIGLLTLLNDRLAARGDLRLHVVHLDHETRAGQSTVDADFVQSLAARWQLPCTRTTLSAVEAANLGSAIPANLSARHRAARQRLYQQVVTAHELQGVILAHHADDQAETVFQRLARGAGFIGLGGMKVRATVRQLRIMRPLLQVPGAGLRALLQERGIAWREDASNASPKYQRNRIRRILSNHPSLAPELLRLGGSCAELRDWAEQTALRLKERFAVRELSERPEILAAHAAQRWLTSRGAPADDLGPRTVTHLLTMARDAASPARRYFPGGVLVRRRGGLIWTERG